MWMMPRHLQVNKTWWWYVGRGGNDGDGGGGDDNNDDADDDINPYPANIFVLKCCLLIASAALMHVYALLTT